jgi:hypothetical protein
MPAPPFQLVHQGLGALPILDALIARIGLERYLTEALDNTRYAHAVLLLVKNIVVERNALYAVAEWASPYDPALVYGGKFSDDVLARALDRLASSAHAPDTYCSPKTAICCKSLPTHTLPSNRKSSACLMSLPEPTPKIENVRKSVAQKCGM